MVPTVVLSLDFEMAWGVQDGLGDTPSRYRNLQAMDDVVPGMLEVFRSHGARATWALVAALACEGWEEWEARAPTWPRYRNQRLAFRPAWKTDAPRCHFAPALVEQVRAAPGQELGSHTFSHVYLTEPGFTRADAAADAAAVSRLFRERWGAAPVSFVPPRIRMAHEDALRAEGIEVWRDNPRPFFWQVGGRIGASKAMGALRVLDALVPLGRRVAPAARQQASFFVRFAFGDRRWKLHQRRILDQARRLRPSETLHLWWHPHDLGAAPDRSLGRLDELLARVQEQAPTGTRFATMRDVHEGADA